MKKLIGYVSAGVVVGFMLGLTTTTAFAPPGSIDFLASHPDEPVRLQSAVTLRDASGHTVVLPEGTGLTIRSQYVDDVTAELVIFASAATLDAASSSADRETRSSYYLD